MPISRSSVAQQCKSITIPFTDGTLNLDYNATIYTPKFESWIRSLRSEDDTAGSSALTSILAKLVSKWDLLNDDNTAVPITEEALAELPISFLNTVLTNIVEDLVPNPPKPVSSGSF